MVVVKSIAATAVALATFVSSVQTNQQPIRVVIDGEQVQFAGRQPTEANDRILVPLRGVFEKLGAKVEWNPSTQTVTATRNETRVKLAIGELDAAVNGKSVQLDVAASLVGGTTMVPLRFVSEALGAHVTWNQESQEVDIASSTDYNIPAPPPPVTAPPPPPPVTAPPPPTVVVERPLRIVRTYDEIAADTVIPLTLDTRLSSRNSKPGDAFTAKLEANGQGRYLNLPAGTQAYGTVSYVKRQHRREPGIIELSFDHLILPDGRSLPVSGRLIGLDEQSVMHRDDGRIVAKSEQRNNTMVFVAYGDNSPVIVSLPTQRPLQDGAMAGLLSSALDLNQRSRLAHDAELHAGVPMGLRLYEGLIVPRKDQ